MVKREKKNMLALLVLPMLLCGCSTDNRQKEVPPTRVKTEKVGKSNGASALHYIGTAEEKESMSLSFLVAGTIKSMNADEGQFVQRGALLASMDESSAISALNAAEASLEQAKDAYNRMDMLYKNASLPDIKMTEIKTKLKQAQATYDIAKKNCKDFRIASPFSGVIGKKILSAGETSVPGQPVYTLLNIDEVRIKITVPETEISDIDPSMVATISSEAVKDMTFKGSRIEKGVEADPMSHTYDVYITVENGDHNILPGMICTVILSKESDIPQILIPVTAVHEDNDERKFVWTAKNGKAERTYISTGEVSGNKIAITKGLDEGDIIVTDGYQKISNGSKIIY